MTADYLITTLILTLAAVALGVYFTRAKSILQRRVEEQHRRIEELEQEASTVREALDTANSRIHDQETRLAVGDSELKAANGRSQELEKELTAARSRLEETQTKVSGLDRALSEATAKLGGEEKRAEDLIQQREQLKDELKQQRQKTGEIEATLSELREAHAKLNTSLKEKEEHFAQQLKALDEQKGILKKEFENLANQIFEAKGKVFAERNKESLDALLNPFRQQINDFKGKVEHLHLEGTKQQTEMRSELKQLQTMHQQMTQEAHSLATALKGQKKVQGNWGELVLENVLERSGLRLGKDYTREESLQTEDGGRGRPDVVVHLPQGKHLIIDAKVSLNDYTRYVNAEDELERQQALNAHVRAFAARIKELSDRDYYKLKGINSPEMVFMFVPIESAFVEALKADETLFQKAIEQNVLVATPTTLLTSLNIVRQLWRYEDQNKHTAELAKKADGVFRKLKTFLTSFEGVKKGLDKAQEAYVRAEGQLVNGPGNLVKQVSDFKQLAPAIKDQLPEYFTDKAELELEYHPDEAAAERPALVESETEIEESETV